MGLRLCVLALILQCGGDSLETYDRVVAEARRCEPGTPCAIAGGVKGCRCPVAVRADMKERVDAAARSAVCRQVERLDCMPLRNAHCENGVCVADEARE